MNQNAHNIPELDKKGLREFGLITGGIVAVLFGLFFPWLLNVSYPVWPWAIFAILAVWALIAPVSLKPVYKGWMRFGLLLNRITMPIILGSVFFLVFAPVAFLMRIFRHDPMARRFNGDIESYRVESKKASLKNMEKPF